MNNDLLGSMVDEFKEANIWRKFILIIEYIIVIISTPIIFLMGFIWGAMSTNMTDEKAAELAHIMMAACPMNWILKFLDFISVF